MEKTTVETPDGLQLEVAHHTADAPHRGTALLAHGLTQDMDEGGMFTRLADCLTAAGFTVVRVTFRGHGGSDGTDRGMTVAGERLDFETAFEHTTATFDGPYVVVAKSFGAVSTCLTLLRYESEIAALALWNPVLGIDGTFLSPTLPWGQANFGEKNLPALREDGSLTLDGGFELSHVWYDELRRYDPDERFCDSSVPALVIHGDADDIVPYEDAKRVAEKKGATFHTIENGDHGFVTPDDQPADGPRGQDTKTVEWLTDRVASR